MTLTAHDDNIVYIYYISIMQIGIQPLCGIYKFVLQTISKDKYN